MRFILGGCSNRSTTLLPSVYSEFFDSDRNYVFVHLRCASIVVLISESRRKSLILNQLETSHARRIPNSPHRRENRRPDFRNATFHAASAVLDFPSAGFPLAGRVPDFPSAVFHVSGALRNLPNGIFQMAGGIRSFWKGVFRVAEGEVPHSPPKGLRRAGGVRSRERASRLAMAAHWQCRRDVGAPGGWGQRGLGFRDAEFLVGWINSRMLILSSRMFSAFR